MYEIIEVDAFGFPHIYCSTKIDKNVKNSRILGLLCKVQGCCVFLRGILRDKAKAVPAQTDTACIDGLRRVRRSGNVCRQILTSLFSLVYA